jgi:glycosyltransferase involved in cell wall biosynthesis
MAVCFIAPFTGRHPGGLTTQGEVLYDLFRAESDEFLGASAKKNRYCRFLDMARFLVVNRRKIDIQCVSVYSGPSFLLADLVSALGKTLGQKVILHLHGGGLPDLFSRQARWARQLLKRGDVIVAPSRFLARAVEALGFPCRIIPNVICLKDYSFRERSAIDPRLFWMRSFHPVWNPEMAVKVLSRLRQEKLPATLVMGGGDKGSLAAVKELAKQLQVENAVRFAGFLGREAKACEGNAADVFLNTNRVDNMPVAVVEACAMGLPVVATSVGGIPDLLTDGETGLLVPSEDVAAMACAVIRLLNDSALALLLSRNGRRLAEQSAWPSVRKQWLDLFRQLVPSLELGI